MRVTQGMLTGNMLRNLSQSYERMGKYQDQLMTGKKVNRPSDDPVVAMKGMNYRTQLTEIEQYQRNMGEMHTWMDNSDAALDQATKALQRVRELAVQASNGTYDQSQRENISKEVEQLKSQLEDIANTKVNNKYIFNGTDTLNPPVDTKNNKYPTNTKPVNITISKGIDLKANINPQNVFDKSLFDDMDHLLSRLKTGSGEDVSKSLGDIDKNVNKLVDERADLGARMNRLDLVDDRLSKQQVTASQVLSDNEDADIEKVITNLKTQESVHRAALSVGAQIIQPTLMDFLR